MSLKSQALALEALGLGMRGRQANNALSADLYKFNRDNTLESQKFDFLRQAQFPEAIRQYDVNANQEQQKIYQNRFLNILKARELPMQLSYNAAMTGNVEGERVANSNLNFLMPGGVQRGTDGQPYISSPPEPPVYNPKSSYTVPTRKRQLFSTPGPQRTTIAKKTWYDDFLEGF